MWYVVLFPKEDGVSVVPASWYIKESQECFWPPPKMKRLDIEKSIKQKHLPEEDWKPYDVKILGKYDDYKEALAKVAKAKEKDKLSSTDCEETGRGKRKRFLKQNSFSSDADENTSSDDGRIIYPNFPNFRHEKVEEILIENPKTPTAGLQEKRRSDVHSAHHGALGRSKQRKTFSRKFSRSLSPENLLSVSLQAVPVTCHDTLENVRIDDRSKSSCEVSGVSHEPTVPLRNLFAERSQFEVATNSVYNKILDTLQKIHADNTEFRVQVMRKLNIINMKLNDLETHSENLQNKEVDPIEAVDNQFSSLFPMEMSTLNNIESLLSDQIYKEKLTKHLSRTGGSDVNDTVKRLMYKMFLNETGNMFSWDGAKGKQKFKHLKISEVIFDAVRANKHCITATDADIVIHIKKWLVRCNDRIKLVAKKLRTNEHGQVQD